MPMKDSWFKEIPLPFEAETLPEGWPSIMKMKSIPMLGFWMTYCFIAAKAKRKLMQPPIQVLRRTE